MSRGGRQSGQTAVEYLGVLLLVSVIIAAIVGSGLGGQISEGLGRAVCQVSGREDCPTSPERVAKAPEEARAERLAQLQREQAFRKAIDPELDDINLDGVPDANQIAVPAAEEKQGLLSRVGDYGHIGLDVCGVVPVVGTPCDGTNAGFYAAQGDFVNAGTSLASAIPVAGQGATAAKYARRAKEAGEAAVEAKRAIRSADPLLTRLGPDTYRSRSGLVYGPDDGPSPFRNRVQHVLAHAEPDLVKRRRGKSTRSSPSHARMCCRSSTKLGSREEESRRASEVQKRPTTLTSDG